MVAMLIARMSVDCGSLAEVVFCVVVEIKIFPPGSEMHLPEEFYREYGEVVVRVG
jgi:hypothetical protein